MRTHRKTEQNQAADLATDLTSELTSEGLCEVATAHDRYTVSFHVTTCRMWVIDSTGRDQPAVRSWPAEALDLNAHNGSAVRGQRGMPR